MFVLLVSKKLPATSTTVPLLSKYLIFTFSMNILSVINTAFVIGFFYEKIDTKSLHPWLRYFLFQLMPSILLVKRKDIRRSLSANNSIFYNHHDFSQHHSTTTSPSTSSQRRQQSQQPQQQQQRRPPHANDDIEMTAMRGASQSAPASVKLLCKFQVRPPPPPPRTTPTSPAESAISSAHQQQLRTNTRRKHAESLKTQWLYELSQHHHHHQQQQQQQQHPHRHPASTSTLSSPASSATLAQKRRRNTTATPHVKSPPRSKLYIEDVDDDDDADDVEPKQQQQQQQQQHQSQQKQQQQQQQRRVSIMRRLNDSLTNVSKRLVDSGSAAAARRRRINKAKTLDKIAQLQMPPLPPPPLPLLHTPGFVALPSPPPPTTTTTNKRKSSTRGVVGQHPMQSTPKLRTSARAATVGGEASGSCSSRRRLVNVNDDADEYISFETLKPSKTLSLVCDSVEYIANVVGEKAELKRVRNQTPRKQNALGYF